MTAAKNTARPNLDSKWQLAVKLRDELEGKRCRPGICDRRKVAGRPFCQHDQVLLPELLAMALERKFFVGYEEAYAAACQFLDAVMKK